MNDNKTDGQSRPEKRLMKCEDIQPLLFDYMSRELGEGRTAAVREHIRKCKSCQALAKDIQATLDLLHTASRAERKSAEHLTDSRRKKIIRAFTHPLISWVEKHILLATVIATVIVISIIASFMGYLVEKRGAPLIGDPVTVRILIPGQTNHYPETNRVDSAGR